MSVTLTLLPLKGAPDLAGTSVFCFDRLKVPQDYRVYGQLTDMSDRHNDDSEIPERPTIKAQYIPEQLWVGNFIEDNTKLTRGDGKGGQITYVYAQELKKLVLPDDSLARMTAIKAFIDALPDDTPIILQWSY